MVLKVMAIVFAVIACVAGYVDNALVFVNGNYLNNGENLTQPPMIVFFVCISISGVLFLLSYILEGNNPVKAVKDKFGSEVGFDIPDSLKPWDNDIRRMCGELGIQGLRCVIEHDPAWLLSSVSAGHRLPTITFSKVKFDNLIRMYSGDIDSIYRIVMFAIGHELGHIKAGDSKGRYNRFVCVVILIAVLHVVLWIDIMFSIISGGLLYAVAVFYGMFLLFVMFVVLDTWASEKFRCHIEEYRADRIGLSVSGVSVDTVRKFGEYYAKYEGMGLSKDKKNDLYPSIDSRISELEKFGNKKWNVEDYVRFTWKYAKDRFKKKGTLE